MHCSPPDLSVHGISQARTLNWVAISFSRDSSWPRNQTCVSCIHRWILYHWATREAPKIASPTPLESLERLGFEATCEEHSGLVVHCLNHLDISPTLSTRKCSFYTHTHTHTHMKINHSFSKCINTYFVCFFYFHSPTFIYTSRFSCTILQNLWGHVFKGLEILSIFFKKKFSLCRSLISFLFFHFSHGISGIQVASFVYNQ